MSKSKRLIDLMMTVNRKRKFKVKELAEEFGVSTRTILRDLQELSELGVPLYSEVGPHGGYQVLRERILPPIAFSEEEAVAIFFAIDALRHYVYIPFEAEASSVLSKFYFYMPGDVRDRIDQMKNRVDFVTPARQAAAPHLAVLLDGAVHQKVLHIEYDSREGASNRVIQPIGIYASNGLWYCPAYCFTRRDYRVFRCDRIVSASADTTGLEPVDLQHIHLGNRRHFKRESQGDVQCYVELSKTGIEKCGAELWLESKLHIREDGTGWFDENIAKSDIPFAAKFFMSLGNEATVKEPQEMVDCIKQMLSELMAKYM